jgi:hypothetical protein
MMSSTSFSLARISRSGDVLEHGGVLLDDFIPLQAGQPLQAHVQDGLGLNVGQGESAP